MTFIPKPHSRSVVYTPEALADALVRALAGNAATGTWLEPSFGDGAFISALNRLGASREQIRGIELETAASPADQLAETTRGTDFLLWAQSTRERFDYVVGNPPYVPIHRLDSSLQTSAIGFRGLDGIQLGSRSNYWCAFVAAGISLLRPSGSLGLVLPSALEYANYADPIRRQLIQLFETIELHRSRASLFADVQDGCVVLIARKFRGGNAQILRREYSGLKTLVAGLSGPGEMQSLPVDSSISHLGDRRPFSDYLDLKIGAVTGDSSYFLLTDEQRRKLNLPASCLRPALTRARHLVDSHITSTHLERLRKEGERVWLFAPTAEIAKEPAIARYLARDHSEGGCDRSSLKVKSRDPWYKTPLPKTPDGFISGMSASGPWIALAGMKRLTASNTLYTVRFKGPFSDPARHAICLALLTSDVRRQWRATCRFYTDQLPKIEPGDINRLILPELPSRIGESAVNDYRSAISHLLAGNEADAIRIADKFFAKPRGT